MALASHPRPCKTRLWKFQSYHSFFFVVVFVTEELLFSSCLNSATCCRFNAGLLPWLSIPCRSTRPAIMLFCIFFFLSLPLACLSFCPFLVSLSLSLCFSLSLSLSLSLSVSLSLSLSLSLFLSLSLSLSLSSLSLSLSLNLSVHQPIVTPLIFWLNYSFFFFFLAT